MSQTVECGAHGEAQTAYVCEHLLSTLQDGVARGAFWSRDEDDCINAYCSDCDKQLEVAGGEWTTEVEAQLKIRIICESCFRRIAAVNGFSELD